MWKRLRSPDSEDLINLEDPPSVESPGDSAPLGGLLGQDTEESDDEDADYIPSGLASFVRQAENTLNSTRATFLSTATRSSNNNNNNTSEPAVFCFDGRSSPPLEDADDLHLKNEVLDRFQPFCGEARSEEEEMLSHYEEDANPNSTEEILFSPDLKTPPPNPHYNISGTEARRLALGTSNLSVDTDILPIRPPSHEDRSASSNSVDEEPVGEDMDPSAWLDHALSTPRPDPPSENIVKSPSKVASELQVASMPESTGREVVHVGDVDETNMHTPNPPSQGVPPTQILLDFDSPPAPVQQAPLQQVPMEIKMIPASPKPVEQVVPMEVVVGETSKPVKESSLPTEILLDDAPTETPAKRPHKQSGSHTNSSKKGSPPVSSGRLSRPTTASSARAAAARQPTPVHTPKAMPTASSVSAVMSKTSGPSRVTKTFKQSHEPPVSTEGQEQDTSLVLMTTSRSPKVDGVPSRLLQETVASKQHHATVGHEPPGYSMTMHPNSPVHVSPEVAPSSRLLQETTASKQRHLAEEEGRKLLSTKSPLRVDIPEPNVSSRLFHETTASKIRHAAVEEQLHSSKQTQPRHPNSAKPSTTVSSRLLQGTSSFQQKLAARAQRNKAPATERHRHGSAELIVSREKAQERVRQRLAKEKAKESSPTHSDKASKISAEEGIARAKERVRLRQQKLREERIAREKENSVRRTDNRAGRASLTPRPGQPQRRSLTVPHPPKLSTSRRQSDRHVLHAGASSPGANSRRAPIRDVEMTPAQSTDILIKALRSDDVSVTSNTSRRELTIPKTPRFSTARIGGAARNAKKPSSLEWKEATTPASSTRFLQNQLRSSDPSLRKKREARLTVPEAPKFHTGSRQTVRKSTVDMSSTRLLQSQLRAEDPSLRQKREVKLTIPSSPKFHKSTRRTVPKSSSEVEREKMEEINSRPFKALPYRPSASKPVQAKVIFSRPSLTVPKPFQLASDRRAASHQKPILRRESSDEVELRKKFHARPMPTFKRPPHTTSTVNTRPAREKSAETEQEKDLSPRLLTSGRASRRHETAQSFATHAEQVRHNKMLEIKRRQRQRHEEEMEKARTRTSPEAIAAKRALESPFRLESQRRHEEFQKRLEDKRREEKEKEKKVTEFRAREFKVVPAPEPKRQFHPPTTPEPFSLQSLERHSAFEEKSRRKLAEEAESVSRQSHFRARPVPNSTYTVASPSAPFMLATTARLRAFEEEKKKREEAELEELRKMSQFKARPLPMTTYSYTGSPSSRSPMSNRGSPDRFRRGDAYSPGEERHHQNRGHASPHDGSAAQPIRLDEATSISPPPVDSITF